MEMKNIFSSIFNAHKDSTSHTIDSSDSYQELLINVPYHDMGRVAEGLKDSFIDDSIATTLVLYDNVYEIGLHIMWLPRIHNKDIPMCTMDRHGFQIFHRGEPVNSWCEDNDKTYTPSIDFTKIQYRINKIVEKDMEQARHSGADLNSPQMKYWLSGHMVMTPLVPIPKIED